MGGGTGAQSVGNGKIRQHLPCVESSRPSSSSSSSIRVAQREWEWTVAARAIYTRGRPRLLPAPDIEWLVYSAAVLCAADGCDHLDCHGGPFRVVFAATYNYRHIIATVYSSETGEWDRDGPAFLNKTCEIYARHMREGNAAETNMSYYTPYLQPRRGTLVEDAVYFTLWRHNAIVKYDLGEDELSMIDAPPTDVEHYVSLMAMENNSLGFACIEGSTLRTWSRKVDTEEAAEWVQYRVIELEKTVPVANPDGRRVVVGFAEGVGVIFVTSAHF